MRKLVAADTYELFHLIDRSRLHLSQFGDTTSLKYPTEQAVYDHLRHTDISVRHYGLWCDDLLMGFAKLTWLNTRRAEIGYWTGQPYVGRGHMTAAVAALTHHGLTAYGLDQLVGWTHPDNLASQRVLLKAGYRAVPTTWPKYLKFTRSAH